LNRPEEVSVYTRPWTCPELLSLDGEKFQQDFSEFTYTQEVKEKDTFEEVFDEIFQLYQEVMDENEDEEPDQHMPENNTHAFTDAETEQVHLWTIERKNLALAFLQQQLQIQERESEPKTLNYDSPTLLNAPHMLDKSLVKVEGPDDEETIPSMLLQQQVYEEESIDKAWKELRNISFLQENELNTPMPTSPNAEYQWKKRKKYKNQKVECDVTAPQNLTFY
jgi:hypothetical protein